MAKAAEPAEEIATKDAVLMALLPNVPFDGWTRAALREAGREAGLDEGAVATLFPHGPRDIVTWFSHWADRLTLETLATAPPEGLKRHDRIALAAQTRLSLLAPHREAVRRALSFFALPANGPLAARLLYDTADALWYAAGDAATDFSFYTKRGMLAGIYAATTLYWLEDRSPDAADTEAFLARRLRDALVLPRLRARFGSSIDSLPNPLRLLRVRRPRF